MLKHITTSISGSASSEVLVITSEVLGLVITSWRSYNHAILYFYRCSVDTPEWCHWSVWYAVDYLAWYTGPSSLVRRNGQRSGQKLFNYICMMPIATAPLSKIVRSHYWIIYFQLDWLKSLNVDISIVYKSVPAFPAYRCYQTFGLLGYCKYEPFTDKLLIFEHIFLVIQPNYLDNATIILIHLLMTVSFGMSHKFPNRKSTYPLDESTDHIYDT